MNSCDYCLDRCCACCTNEKSDDITEQRGSFSRPNNLVIKNNVNNSNEIDGNSMLNKFNEEHF